MARARRETERGRYGAELNCEMERQTERDIPMGRPRPRGERGAYGADPVGERP